MINCTLGIPVKIYIYIKKKDEKEFMLKIYIVVIQQKNTKGAKIIQL